MFLYVHSSIAIILMGKRELVALLNVSSWCLVMVELLFLHVLAVPRGCLQFVIVVFPDHTHYFYCILFSRIALKDIFAKLKKSRLFIGIRKSDFAIPRSFTNIKPSQKFPNFQNLNLVYWSISNLIVKVG